MVSQNTDQHMGIDPVFLVVRVGAKPQVSLQGLEPILRLRQADIEGPEFMFIERPFIGPQHIATA